MYEKKVVGIIDLGSNSSRLSIYEYYPNQSYRPVFEMKRSVQLARSLAQNMEISEAGLARAVVCTKLFLRTGELYGVSDWIPVATAAIRQAKNQRQVLDRLEEETSIRFRVLSGEEEGYYGYLGVVNTLNVQNALIFDVGGASSEIMLVRQRTLERVASIPYGSLNLTEMFAHLPEGQQTPAIQAFFAEQLRAIPWLAEVHAPVVIGLGGTARAMAKLNLSAEAHKSSAPRIHGYEISPVFVTEEMKMLTQMPAAKVKKIKGLSKHRAEIIRTGLSAMLGLVNAIEPKTILVSRNGIREGLFFEYFRQDHENVVLESVLDESIDNFLKIYGVNRDIANVIQAGALSLYDRLQTVHQLTAEDRKLLWVTAQIESCGCYINTEKWTKHSAYLALSSNLFGLTYSELGDVADMLIGKGPNRLKKLMMFIRLAKLFGLQLGLNVDEISVSVKAKAVYLAHASSIREQLLVSADATIEREFKSIFGRDLIIGD
jgi:exopolyphosphatase/guanosine-5'-triphosphate,3'-diphosphate pyrophosphatase